MKASMSTICVFGVVAIGGCGLGHRMKASEFAFVHPAVEWAYAPGYHTFISSLLGLPMRGVNRIVMAELGRDCVIVTEEQSSTPEMTVWRSSQPPRYSLSLRDGSPVKPCAGTGMKLRSIDMQDDEKLLQMHATLPNGLIVATRIVDKTRCAAGGSPTRVPATHPAASSAGGGIQNYATSVFVGRDVENVVEIVRCKRLVGSPGYLEAPNHRLLIVFPEMLLCIDESRVSE